MHDECAFCDMICVWERKCLNLDTWTYNCIVDVAKQCYVVFSMIEQNKNVLQVTFCLEMVLA